MARGLATIRRGPDDRLIYFLIRGTDFTDISATAHAANMRVTVPDKVNEKEQAMIDKMSTVSKAEFDRVYGKERVNDHRKDFAEFETAGKEVKNADLKKFIDGTVPGPSGYDPEVRSSETVAQLRTTARRFAYPAAHFGEKQGVILPEPFAKERT